jgi:hypothetical protein
MGKKGRKEIDGKQLNGFFFWVYSSEQHIRYPLGQSRK